MKSLRVHRRIETLALFLMVIALGAVALNHPSLLYLFFALSIWSALRLGRFITRALLLVVIAESTFFVGGNGSSIFELGSFLLILVVFSELILHALSSAQTENAKLARESDLFVERASHDLRSPLTTILAWSQLLQMAKVSDDKLKNGLSTIQRNARLQERTLDDLMDASEIRKGKLLLQLQRVDLSSVALTAADVMRPLAEAQSVNLETQIQATAEAVSVDPIRLDRIIRLLLSNAIKFSRAGGTIKLEVDHSEGQPFAHFQISDDGTGMDQALLDKPDRIGSGLFIARALVRLHGGELHIESPGKNQGTKCTFTLPVAVTPKPLARTVSPALPGKRRVSG